MAYTQEFLDHLTQNQDVFIWEAPAHEAVERGKRWYLYMALIALLFTGYAIYTANYLFAFIVLLTAMILTFAGSQKPEKILIQIGNNGVVYDGKLYMYDDLYDFAIIYNPPETKVLYIEPKGWAKPRLRISLEDEDPVAIRGHLKKYLEEDLDLRDEHVSDIFGRLLKL